MKTRDVWAPGRGGWVGRCWEGSGCGSPGWLGGPVGRPHSSWMATLKNDLSLHNLTFGDAVKVALGGPLWGLLAASGATH